MNPLNFLLERPCLFFYKIKVLKIEKNRKKMVLLIEAETRGLNTYIFIGQNLIQKFLVLENFRAF